MKNSFCKEIRTILHIFARKENYGKTVSFIILHLCYSVRGGLPLRYGCCAAGRAFSGYFGTLANFRGIM